MTFLEGTFRNVVSKFTGEFVVSRARVFIVFSDWTTCSDGEFASEAVVHL